MTTEPPAAFGVQEALAYWDDRHRRLDELRSGGDMGYDHGTNELFYALRLGRLIDVVGDATSPGAPLRMLDAGCGKGWFTRAMASFGHRVDGIDASPAAIEECRRLAVGGDTYTVSVLGDWAPPYLYDVVYSVDVLFHLLDDEVWRSSMVNLASLVRTGGLLVVADHVTDHDRQWGRHQKTRAPQRYRDLLAARGFRYERFVPYRFRTSPVGFHVATRIG